MKTPLYVFLLLFTVQLSAQEDKYANTFICTDGKVHFFSSSPIEDIEATTRSTICVLNTQTKKLYAKIPITSFDFKDKLMQEHFNENYLESNKFPSAVLDMVVAEDIDFTKDGAYDITLKGTLEIHGIKQKRDIKGQIIIKKGQPETGLAEFVVKLADYGIKIPKAVVMNIAETLKVDVKICFSKYQKK